MPQYFKDLNKGQIGEFVGNDGPDNYLLRPIGGGIEWGCPHDEADPVTPDEVLWAEVEVQNRRSASK